VQTSSGSYSNRSVVPCSKVWFEVNRILILYEWGLVTENHPKTGNQPAGWPEPRTGQHWLIHNTYMLQLKFCEQCMSNVIQTASQFFYFWSCLLFSFSLGLLFFMFADWCCCVVRCEVS